MISTANYVARTFGVRSAMPGFIAKKLCPQLVFVKPDFKKYTAAAESVREVLATFNPDYHSRGLDEASLEVSEYCAEKNMTPAQVRSCTASACPHVGPTLCARTAAPTRRNAGWGCLRGRRWLALLGLA